MRQDLQIGELVEHAGKDDARHRRRGLVGPAETPEDLVFRFVLGLVVGVRHRPRRMQEDRLAEALQSLEHREEGGIVERPPVDVGMDLRAAGAELGRCPVDFLHRCVRVVHRQAQKKARKPVRVGAADRGHAVIGDPGEGGRPVGAAEDVDRRLRHRDHLLVVAELVEQPQPGVHVPERLDGAPARHRAFGHGLGQCLDEDFGKDMVEDIELH